MFNKLLTNVWYTITDNDMDYNVVHSMYEFNHLIPYGYWNVMDKCGEWMNYKLTR